MAAANIRILADYRAMDAELDRISRMPDPRMVRLLDTALNVGFDVTQADVHILTGSLKASGKHDHETNQALHQWEGTIEYGGVSTGVNNPVDYAIYEKRRGGAHDFTAGLALIDPLFRAAMRTGLAPERGR
jgi:hypothetical protein